MVEGEVEGLEALGAAAGEGARDGGGALGAERVVLEREREQRALGRGQQPRNRDSSLHADAARAQVQVLQRRQRPRRARQAVRQTQRLPRTSALN
eukprot:2772519-Rhodomonas_salina.1